jgi:hypothetical protein
VAANVRERHHFRLAYGVLALAFWVSVAGFTYLMTRGGSDGAKEQWSAWRPAQSDLSGAREISRHVARAYRADTGRQLVAVQEHPPEIQGLALEAIAIRRQSSAGAMDPYIALYGGRRTLIYAFCGLGRNCTLPGTATTGRDRLLRREALELALYSFKYIDGIDSVVSLLPPSASARTTAVFLRKDEVRDLLDRPIRATLPRAIPPTESQYAGSEATFVENVTGPRTFPAQFEALPDGDAILVLQLGATSGAEDGTAG